MENAGDRLFVLTGGPGAGKTTLVEALAETGFARTIEAGRAVIQDQVAIGGSALPWEDRARFAELMLAFELRSHREAKASTGPVFCDRGLPDIVGYLRLEKLPVPAHVRRAAETLRYAPRVFLLPPWPEIFGQDAERQQDFATAVRTAEAMRTAYADLGYEVVDVPRAPLGARVRFVLDRIGTRPCGAHDARPCGASD